MKGNPVTSKANKLQVEKECDKYAYQFEPLLQDNWVMAEKINKESTSLRCLKDRPE